MPHAPALTQILVVATCVAAIAAPTAAQEMPLVRVGERVRITYSFDNSVGSRMRITGTLVERRGDTLVVQPASAGLPVALPLPAIWQLDRRVPAERRIVTNTLIGTGVGAVTVAGFWMVASAVGPCFDGCPPAPRREVLTAAAIGALLGGGGTAAVSTLVLRARTWKSVPLPAVASAAIAPSGHAAVAFTLRRW